ncbi:MAG TPA: S53 family peptidase [Streptosporangiaceae bacterium]
MSLAVAAAAPPAAAGPAVATTPAAVTPAAVTPAAGTPAAVTPAAGTPAAGGARPVLLITGARLAMLPGPAGRPVPVLLPPASGSSLASGAMMTMGRAGNTAKVPVAALPFLGRGLDPALFDGAALRRAERGGQLPVQITYPGRVPRLPGVTITHASAGTATGFLTARSAPAFGAALSRQFAADHDRAAYGTDGLFAHGVRIALAGGPRLGPSRPRFVLHTIVIHGTDLAGRPDNGDSISLVSADNTNVVAGGGVFRHGIARMTVPAGHYWASGLIFAKGKIAFVFPPEFTVPASGANPHVTMDGHAATSVLSVSTPRPAVVDSESFTQIIRGKAGPPVAFILTVLGVLARQLHIVAAPAHYTPALGSLQTITQEQLASPRGAAQQYAYSLDFPGPLNQVPSQHFTADPARLATVTENYFQDRPSAGGWVTAGGTTTELEGGPGVFPNPLRLPGQQIQYLTADPGVFWQSRYVEFGTTQAGGQAGALRSYRPGDQLTEDWGRYPLHPVAAVSLARQASVEPGFTLPPAAARAGDTLSLSPVAFSDSTPGHQGSGSFLDPGARVTERYQVDQDGARLAAGDASGGIPPVLLSPRPSAVRFTLSARRAGPHYVLSPSSTTTWQWRSQRDKAAKVPAPWACPAAPPPATRLTRACAVQPMMTLAYQVAGLSLAGSTAPGHQAIGLTAGHLQLAAAPAVTSAGLQVSFDGGKAWQAAQVTAGAVAGQYTASFTAPAGAFVSLRATAADAADGSVTETITRAYRTAPMAARTTAAVQPAAGAASPPPSGFISPPCARPQAGQAQCFLSYRPQNQVNRATADGQAAAPQGLSAAALRSAYRLRSPGSPGQTVAVSIAFHTPHLARYLAAYRRQFGLPTCTVASGCFRQVNQHGGTKPEPSGVGTGWDLEATLDVSMISAACPRCHILVVEGKDPTPADLAATERTAARLGAQVISNSYGIGEDGFSLPFRRAYQRRGHTVVAASGDSGFTDPQVPADLPTVTSVGGTMLTRAHNRRGWHERAWREAGVGAGGSGCSAWIAKPSWQHDTHCPMRTIADISAVASNIPVFISVYGGWVTVAGTSAAAPLVAGIYGLAGNGTTITTARLYRHRRSFFDITTGSNVFGPPRVICGGDYLCTAKKGYDAPTGLGTPDGPGGL